MKYELQKAADVHKHIINEGHKVLENKHHEVHGVLEVLRVMAMVLCHVKHEGVHRAGHVRANEGVHVVQGITLEVVHRAVDPNTVKMSKKYIKLNSLGEDVCRIQVALDFLKIDNIVLDQILKGQETKLNMPGPP